MVPIMVPTWVRFDSKGYAIGETSQANVANAILIDLPYYDSIKDAPQLNVQGLTAEQIKAIAPIKYKSLLIERSPQIKSIMATADEKTQDKIATLVYNHKVHAKERIDAIINCTNKSIN